jgi:hypothetical protein
MTAANIYADRVKETSASTGTGSFTLDGAATGFVTFNAAYGPGVDFNYVIEAGSAWEVGRGSLSDSTTLARTQVLASSNSGSAVDFAAGTKDVFSSIPAAAMNALAGGNERRHDYVAPYSYCGTAPAASGDDDPVWTIVRLTISAAGAVTATETATNVAWDDRLTETYS